MIVRMKKVTALCLEDDTDRTLKALGNLGVLHLVPTQQPQGADLDKTRKQLDRARDAIVLLRTHHGHTGEETGGADTPPPEIVERTHRLRHEMQSLEETRLTLIKERDIGAPFGDFDPNTVRALAEQGVTVRLYHTTSKAPIEAPEGAVLAVTQQGGLGQYFALLGDTPDFTVNAREVPLPARSLEAVAAEIGETDRRLSKIDNDLGELSLSSDLVAEWVESLEQSEEYLLAQTGMGAAGRIAYLQGFCPVHAVDKVRRCSHDHGWGLVTEEPSEEDAVPTLVQYPSWVRVMRPVFAFLGIVPGYREADISSAFLVFLSIFFAMIVGDAGYGVLFLILIPYLRKKKFAKAEPEPFRLLYIFSGGTVLWGMLTGNYFGIDFELLPPFLRFLRVDWLIDQNNSMTFSLILGAVHLTLAHGWRAVGFGRDARAAVQLGWIGVVWGVFVLARHLLVGSALPVWVAPAPALGLAAILVGLVLRKKWMDLGLLLLDLVSCFGDLMSYLRLFALGIASVKVAEAFNTMAGDLGAALVGMAGGTAMVLVSGILAAAAMALVLALGHGLNIILCAMSVLVHGVRLNALEFSLHMGQEWSGFKYKPFASPGSVELKSVA